MGTSTLAPQTIGHSLDGALRPSFGETTPQFQGLIDRIREANKVLVQSSTFAPVALSTLRETHRGDFLDSLQEQAIDELLDLRETLDNLTRQFLYGTWSRRLKEQLGESMQGTKWTFPEW